MLGQLPNRLVKADSIGPRATQPGLLMDLMGVEIDGRGGRKFDWVTAFAGWLEFSFCDEVNSQFLCGFAIGTTITLRVAGTNRSNDL
jgi:hypothetical protein